MTKQVDNKVDDVICTCTGTTYGEIAELASQGYDLDGISRKKGVLSGCGGCEWDVEVLLDELAK